MKAYKNRSSESKMNEKANSKKEDLHGNKGTKRVSKETNLPKKKGNTPEKATSQALPWWKKNWIRFGLPPLLIVLFLFTGEMGGVPIGGGGSENKQTMVTMSAVDYGDPLTDETAKVEVADILNSPLDYEGDIVVVEGELGPGCVSGCHFQIVDGEEAIFAQSEFIVEEPLGNKVKIAAKVEVLPGEIASLAARNLQVLEE